MTTSFSVIPGRWLWQLVFCAVLAGCVAPQGDDGSDGGAAPVVAGNVVIAAPSGFCVLEDSRFVQGTAEFAALLPCESRLKVFGEGVMVVLTVTVGEEGTANGIDMSGKGLADYFTGEEGRAALSRVGKAATVKVHEVRDTGGAVVVRMTDQSARWPGMGWRAVTGIRGHLVTLTVRGNGETPLTEAQGKRLMDRFVAAMRRANRS